MTKRRFFLVGKAGIHSDHFVVLGEGKLDDVAPHGPVAEGAELQVELVELDRHDGGAAVAHLDGIDVCVGDGAELVGKKVKVRVERVLEGVAYASLVRRTAKKAVEPLTAEGEAEKPTRKPPARKAEEVEAVEAVEGVEEAEEAEEVEEVEVDAVPDAVVDESETETETERDAEAAAKKKTRRGTRGGRNRKKKPVAAAGDAPAEEAVDPVEKKVTIHLPPADLGEPEAETETAPSENGDTPAGSARKRTRRGSRGGKNRRKREAAAAVTADTNGQPAEERPDEPEPAENWGYVPMSQWGDEFE